MIDERFLHYKTQAGFEKDLDEYGEELLYDKIIFIKDKALIWTHGAYYGVKEAVQAIPVVTEQSSGLMTPQLYKALINIRDIDIPTIKADIKALQDLISTDSADITEIIEKFEAIVEFINSLGDSDDGTALLNEIIQRITKTENTIKAEITRAKNREDSLQEQINNMSSGNTPNSGDGIKHVFLTQEEYDSLEEYDENTIYFILENQNWTFGGTFPVILS